MGNNNSDKNTKIIKSSQIIALVIVSLISLISMIIMLEFSSVIIKHFAVLIDNISKNCNPNTACITLCVICAIFVICCTIIICVLLCKMAACVKFRIEKNIECEKVKELSEHINNKG